MPVLKWWSVVILVPGSQHATCKCLQYVQDGIGVEASPVLQTFKDSYRKTPGLQRSTLGDDHAFCVYCLSDINISHSGQFDIETHCKSMKHKKYVSAKKDVEKCPKLLAFFTSTPKTTKSGPEVLDVTRAEVMLTETLVKLNVPLSAADTLENVVKIAFPDSAIAKKLQLCEKQDNRNCESPCYK